MSKRTDTFPYVVEMLWDGKWTIVAYENSPKMARRAVRDKVEHFHRAARARGNPHNEHRDEGVIYEVTPGAQEAETNDGNSSDTPPTQSTEPLDDAEFVNHVTELNEISKLCAEETIYRADLRPEDRNTILRAVIRRLEDAISGK
jgi:hypothetical protein